MVEIKCSQEEKEALITILAVTECYCFLPVSCPSGGGSSCMECLEKNIKWEITDGGK